MCMCIFYDIHNIYIWRASCDLLKQTVSECIYHRQCFNTSLVWLMSSPDYTVVDSAEKISILSIPVWLKQRTINETGCLCFKASVDRNKKRYDEHFQNWRLLTVLSWPLLLLLFYSTRNELHGNRHCEGLTNSATMRQNSVLFQKSFLVKKRKMPFSVCQNVQIIRC